MYRHLERHYPPLIAHTGSCARPNPSHLLQPPAWSAGLCRLRQAPAGRWPFPTLSLQSLRRCLDPYPAVSSRCIRSFLPGRQRPHVRRHTFGTLKYPCNATSTGLVISGLQSFRYVQAPTLARPPGCTHRRGLNVLGAAGPFTPPIARLVTCHGLWYRYVSDTSN